MSFTNEKVQEAAHRLHGLIVNESSTILSTSTPQGSKWDWRSHTHNRTIRYTNPDTGATLDTPIENGLVTFRYDLTNKHGITLTVCENPPGLFINWEKNPSILLVSEDECVWLSGNEETNDSLEALPKYLNQLYAHLIRLFEFD